MQKLLAILALLGALGLAGPAAHALDVPNAPPAAAAPAQAVAAAPLPNKGDIAWMLTSTALVLMMSVPALALFYGGLVRSKNALSTMMQVFFVFSLISVLWCVYGYSLAFTEGNAFIGGFDRLFLNGTFDAMTGAFAMAATFSKATPLPELVFVAFQATFAAITCCLVLGAFQERTKFAAVLIFVVIWFTFSYAPIAHMVWFWPGPDAYTDAAAAAGLNAKAGLIWQWGALDFAGGTVVHINAGVAGIVGAYVVGKRVGYGREAMSPHNLTLTMIGAALLWTGWFGFNAGSALSASPLAALAFLNTSTAASTAVVAWALIEYLHRGKPTALGGATAAVAGLVAITPACGNVAPMGSIAIGIGVAIISYAACTFLKPALDYDDSLDVFGVHALGGAWGALASGIFAVTLGSGVQSNVQQVIVQLKGMIFTMVFAPVATIVILYVLNAIMGSLRVTDEDEYTGLDLSQHSETAYEYGTKS
jgi:Amt family ammonium transporter